MEQISSTALPEETLPLVEWMKEYRIGIMAPKPDNGRAKQMMDMWGNEEDYFEKKLRSLNFGGIFRS